MARRARKTFDVSLAVALVPAANPTQQARRAAAMRELARLVAAKLEEHRDTATNSAD